MAFLGFFVAVVWIYSIANEIVNLLQVSMCYCYCIIILSMWHVLAAVYISWIVLVVSVATSNFRSILYLAHNNIKTFMVREVLGLITLIVIYLG